MKRTLLIFLTIALALNAYAGSATWRLNAGDGNWNNASHWIPKTVPNGPNDTATFDLSNTLIPSIFADTEVNSIVFDSGASTFTTTVMLTFVFTLSGAGIINSSGRDQNFQAAADSTNDAGTIIFTGAATAGTQTTFTIEGAAGNYAGEAGHMDFFGASTAGSATIINQGTSISFGGETEFHDSSTGGDATFINYGGAGSFGGNGETLFVDTSTAGNATMTNKGATGFALGGFVEFFGSSTAANAVITNEGSSFPDGEGGRVIFWNTASAGNAILIVYGSTTPIGGAWVQFTDSSTANNATIICYGEPTDVDAGLLSFINSGTGGTARVELFGKGTLWLRYHEIPQVKIGSIEGDGFVTLENNELVVGSNNLSTSFSGIIDDAGLGGSLTKIGNGTLVLLNANSYAGGTRVKRGALKVNNTGGSGTGSGPVQVDGGSFGGTGIVNGAVMVGNRRAAKLAPGNHGSGSLTILDTLTFGRSGKYSWSFDSRRFRAESLTAQGTTIEGGALFSPLSIGNVQLPLGTVFVVINNLAATPIAGSFANLADGGTITIGLNNFQADYEGGDGNDLTLTVVP